MPTAPQRKTLPDGFDTPLDEDSLAAQFGGGETRTVSPSGPKAPPAAPRARPGGTGPRVGAPPRATPPAGAPRVQPFEKRIVQFYEQIGGLVTLIDPSCGVVIIECAPDMGHSMSELAATNPAVKRVLMGLLEKSALSLVIAAHLPVVLAIAAHHTPLPRVLARRTLGDDASNEDLDAFGDMMVKGLIDNVKKAKSAVAEP